MKRMFALLGILMMAVAAQAEVKTKVVEYEFDGTKLKGFLAYDDAKTGKLPGVLVVHEWWGLNEYAKERAKKLAELGYAAFCVDMYGDGKTTEHPEEAGKMATTVRNNLKAWQGRAQAGLKVMNSQPMVDKTRTAAIGYCFGGSTCLQLAYTGADLKAVATFHAALPTPDVPAANAINAKVLVCNGADDTFIPAASIKAFRDALDKAKVSYEFVNYPGAVHSFTVKDADKVGNKGMAYNKDADEKSWESMKKLLAETLK